MREPSPIGPRCESPVTRGGNVVLEASPLKCIEVKSGVAQRDAGLGFRVRPAQTQSLHLYLVTGCVPNRAGLSVLVPCT